MSDPNQDQSLELEIRPVTEVVKGKGFAKVAPDGGIANARPNGVAQAIPKGPQKSQAIPFMTVPAYMDGSMAGDVGFDPLKFADSEQNLLNYREAEIKHARLAMLAAAGWPISELFDKKIANIFGMEAVVDSANRVPSVLNGGMGKISPVYWAACIILAGAIDLFGVFSVSKKEGYFPGNYGFDPFGLYPTDEKGQKWMQTAEIKNGRLAMIAITGFCFQELVTNIAVVDQTPIFFKPIFEVLSSDNGYIYPDAATAGISTIESISSAAETVTVAPPVDIVSATASEATVAIPSFESVTAIIPETSTVTPSASAASAETVAPLIESISGLPADAAAAPLPSDAAPTVPMEELIVAKQRIVELESKLAAISQLSQ